MTNKTSAKPADWASTLQHPALQKMEAQAMTEKTLTQRSDELRKNAPGPTVEPNSQDWAALGGAVAHHLIERHAGNWADVELMMEEFAATRVKAAQQTSLTPGATTDSQREPEGAARGRRYVLNVEAARAASVKQQQLATLTAEHEALRKAALKAACTAFGMLATSYPEDLPDDAQELAEWMIKKNLHLVPDDERPEESFINIIRTAMAREP